MAEPAMPNLPELSIVVPALNEEDNVQPLVERVQAVAEEAGIRVELIVVDDGSTDATLERLVALCETHPWVRVLHRKKPQGQSAATYAGIAVAAGPYLATLDADLQNDPADLPEMLKVVRRGEADMAQGMRAKRQDNVVRKVASWVGRTTRQLLLGDDIRDTGCATRVVRTEIARQYPLQYRGMHRFIPVYTRALGYKVVEMPVRHHPRVAGVTKYGQLSRAYQGLIDCFAMRWMRSRLRAVAAEERTPMPARVSGSEAAGETSSRPAHQKA